MLIQPTTTIRSRSGLSVSSKHPFQEQLLTDLFTAYYKARANKRNTYTQMRFERNLSFNMVALYNEIITLTYKVDRSMCFIVNRPVKREVFAATFSGTGLSTTFSSCTWRRSLSRLSSTTVIPAGWGRGPFSPSSVWNTISAPFRTTIRRTAGSSSSTCRATS